MGKHTTPGLDTPGTRDDIVGWGAFSTVVAVILVGLFAGWFEAVGVLALGGLATAALWFARNHSADALARGRHASETPWSASDLLELKDADAQQAGARRDPSRRRPEPAPRAADVAGAGRDEGSVAGAAAVPAPEPADLETAGARAGRRSQGRQQGRPQSRPQSRPQTRPQGRPGRTQAGDPLAWLPGQQTGDGPDADDAPTQPDGPPVTDGEAGRRSGRRAAGPPVIPGQAGGAGVLAAAAAPTASGAPGLQAPGHPGVPAARTPSSRRSRRTGEPSSEPGAGSRGVLPVAPFEMGAPTGHPYDHVPAAPPAPPTLPGVQVPAGTLPVPTPMTGVAQPAAGPLPVAPVPVAPQATLRGASAATAAPVPVLPSRRTPDPLSGPLNLDAVAAEPTVLDPALDPLWLAPAVDLTVEQQRVDQHRVDQHRVDQHPTEPHLVDQHRADQHRAEQPAAPTQRSVADRAGAAAAIDPLWARRARRPEIRRPGAPRPAAVRREPAPLEPIPRDQATSSEPYLVVLPEPDVPDVLMLPESDVVLPDDAGRVDSWNGTPDVPVSRPAPGTLSLDELLVLHTRRPVGRRTGSDDQATEITERRLE